MHHARCFVSTSYKSSRSPVRWIFMGEKWGPGEEKGFAQGPMEIQPETMVENLCSPHYSTFPPCDLLVKAVGDNAKMLGFSILGWPMCWVRQEEGCLAGLPLFNRMNSGMFCPPCSFFHCLQASDRILLFLPLLLILQLLLPIPYHTVLQLYNALLYCFSSVVTGGMGISSVLFLWREGIQMRDIEQF